MNLSLPEDSNNPDVARVSAAVSNLQDIMEMRLRDGFWPVPGRKQLLQSPIWHDPRVARAAAHGGKMFFLWKEKGLQQAIGTTNTQPTNNLKDATGSYNPGGLLQWMDLDLMMFLTALFTDRRDKVIDADQRNIFDAIGYQRLEDPPYEELRSSIKRLTGTQIWEFEETQQGELNYNLLPPLLITTDQEKRLWVKDGRKVRLVVAIGNGWVSEVRADNQVVDLNSYLYLVREIRNGDARRRRATNLGQAAYPGDEIDRPPDIARSVLLFCDSLRRQQKDKSFVTVLKSDWLMERFADRQSPIPYLTSKLDLDRKAQLAISKRDDLVLDQSRRVKEFFGEHKRPAYVYVDPMHPNGKVRRSLDALAKLRIFKHYQLDGDKLVIEWNDPKALPRLEVKHRSLIWSDDAKAQVGYTSAVQGKFLVQDKITGDIHFVEPAEPEEIPMPAAAAANPATDSNQAPFLPKPTSAASGPSTATRTERLLHLVELAQGPEVSDQVAIRSTKLMRERGISEWESLEAALKEAIGENASAVLLSRVRSSVTAAEVSPNIPTPAAAQGEQPRQALRSESTAGEEEWDPLLNHLLNAIPELNGNQIPKWKTAFRDPGTLVAMLVEAAKEAPAALAQGVSHARRAGLYAQQPNADRWSDCLASESWCQNVEALCEKEKLKVPTGLKRLIKNFSDARKVRSTQTREKTQHLQEQRKLDAERRDEERARQVVTFIAIIDPWLTHWGIGENRKRAHEIVKGHTSAISQWNNGLKTRDVPILRDIFMLFANEGLVEEAKFPVVDNLLPR